MTLRRKHRRKFQDFQSGNKLLDIVPKHREAENTIKSMHKDLYIPNSIIKDAKRTISRIREAICNFYT